MKRILILTLFFQITYWANAQSSLPSLDELSFDIKYCGGAIYKHTQKVTIDPPSYSQELELSISHRTRGKRLWERQNNFPTPSINFCFSQYGNKLGNAFSFYPGIEWSVLRKQKINWRFKIGGGIGLASDAWSREDTSNNYLGSQLNNFTVIQTGINFKVSKKLELQAGGRLSHMSNGAFRIPNFGVNLFSGFIGVNYYPMAIQQPTVESTIPKAVKRSVQFGLRSSLAWGELNAPNGPLYTIYTHSIYAATPLRRKHLFIAGIDIIRNNKALSGYRYVQRTGNLQWAATSSSIFAGGELLYGRIGLPFQIGVYIKKLKDQNAVWYQKFGFQYYFYKKDTGFLKRMYVGPMLKTNKINADYFEFNLGAMF